MFSRQNFSISPETSLSTQRFDFPIGIIPIAPIGLYMLSKRGFLVLLVETFEFLPVFIYATFPRRKKTAAG